MSRGLAGLAFLFVTIGTTQAGVVPGRWDKVEKEQPGSMLQIVLLSGDELQGAFAALTPEELVIRQDGTERRIPKASVQSIVTSEKRRDSAADGAIAGAVVGGLGGLLTAVGFLVLSGGDVGSSGGVEVLLPMTGIGAGVGTAAGYLIDRAHPSSEVLYQAYEHAR